MLSDNRILSKYTNLTSEIKYKISIELLQYNST